MEDTLMAAKILTDTSIKALKPSDKTRKITVGGCPGLVLMVSPAGGKVFRLQFTFEGKSQLLTIGPYPSVSLYEARATALLHKENIRKGINPCAEKRESKAKAQSNAVTFRKLAEEWLEKFDPTWSDNHKKDIRQKLNCYVLPVIGDKPVMEVGKAEIGDILNILDSHGKYPTLKKIRSLISKIFKFAIARDLHGVTSDPTTLFVRQGLFTPTKVAHRAAITSPPAAASLMKSIFAYEEISKQTSIALKFSALTFARPGEIRRAEWNEIEWEECQWRIPAEKMKMRKVHIVPLATQTLEILRELHPMTCYSKYLFPAIRSADRPMSEVTILAALRRMGFSKQEMTAHGFRGMASSLLNEQGYRSDWIEKQLAHGEQDQIRAAYNHADYLPDRKKMLQEWADFLWKLAEG